MPTTPAPGLAATLRQAAAPIAWSTFIAIPASGWGRLDGMPLGPFEAAAIALVWWIWAAGKALPGTPILVALVVAKVAVGALFLDRGFEARYYANESWTAPFESSTAYPDSTFTRLDERLAFSADRPPSLPLYFFNDNRRFNFYGPEQPRREALGFSATWDGYLYVERRQASATFYVEADEASFGELSIDGRPIVLFNRGPERTGTAALEPGWHAVSVRLSAPYGAGRRIAAGEIVGGTPQPFDGRRVLPAPVEPARLAVDAALGMGTLAIDWGVLAWLGWLALVSARDAVREARIGRLLWLAAGLEALRYAGRYWGQAVMLGGGDDFLTYETYARAILLEDLVRAGQDGPFYMQPLYPYAVALTHAVFGEDLFGIVLVQRLLVAATIGWAGAIAARLFGATAGWAGVAFGALLLYDKLGRWSNVLLAEPLFTPLLVAWTWILIRIATEAHSSPRVLLGGIVGGLATLMRSTLLLAWPVTLPLWWISLRRQRTRTVTILVLVMLALVGTATLRNWVISRQFVLVASSFSINLSLGNQPPRPLAPPPPGRSALYERFGLDGNTRGVAEYALQEPQAFIKGLGRKALYSLGFYEMSGLGNGEGTAWLYVLTWALALAGLGRVRRASPALPAGVLWLPLAGALVHLAAVVLIFPYGYSDRLIVPLYPLLIPYAAVALEPSARWAQPYALAALGALSTLGAAAQRRLASNAPVLSGLRARALPVITQPRNWPYLAYSAAVILGLDWRPDESDTLDVPAALLLPAVALAVARLTRADSAHRLAGGTIWAAALVHVATGGSRSADALHDPLFWGVVSVVALGLSLVTGRWPAASTGGAVVAGACAMVAILLPRLPGFGSGLLDPSLMAAGASINVLVQQFGIAGLVCLLWLWVQAIVAGGRRGVTATRVVAATGSALAVALLMVAAGAVPGTGGAMRLALLVLGLLLGLAEADARRPQPRG